MAKNNFLAEVIFKHTSVNLIAPYQIFFLYSVTQSTNIILLFLLEIFLLIEYCNLYNLIGIEYFGPLTSIKKLSDLDHLCQLFAKIMTTISRFPNIFIFGELWVYLGMSDLTQPTSCIIFLLIALCMPKINKICSFLFDILLIKKSTNLIGPYSIFNCSINIGTLNNKFYLLIHIIIL